MRIEFTFDNSKEKLPLPFDNFHEMYDFGSELIKLMDDYNFEVNAKIVFTDSLGNDVVIDW